MAQLIGSYADLRFTREQIFLDASEALEVAHDFWGPKTGLSADALTDQDRAFVQGCLLIAVDKSEQAGVLFDVFSSFMTAAPRQSVRALVKSLAKKTARRWFDSIIDDDPKISAVGKAAVQNTELTAEWRHRWQLGDTSYLHPFLIE
jgi:hypothetical protein